MAWVVFASFAPRWSDTRLGVTITPADTRLLSRVVGEWLSLYKPISTLSDEFLRRVDGYGLDAGGWRWTAAGGDRMPGRGGYDVSSAVVSTQA